MQRTLWRGAVERDYAYGVLQKATSSIFTKMSMVGLTQNVIITLYGKGDFANGLKLRIFSCKWLYMRAPCMTGTLLRENRRFIVIERRIWKCYSVGFKDGELVTSQSM